MSEYTDTERLNALLECAEFANAQRHVGPRALGFGFEIRAAEGVSDKRAVIDAWISRRQVVACPDAPHSCSRSGCGNPVGERLDNAKENGSSMEAHCAQANSLEIELADEKSRKTPAKKRNAP